jgi:hypothetical protein
MRETAVASGVAPAPQPRVQPATPSLADMEAEMTNCVGKTIGCGWNKRY